MSLGFADLSVTAHVGMVLRVARLHEVVLDPWTAASASFPNLLRIEEDTPASAYFYAQGGGETVIAGMTDYNDSSGSKRQAGWVKRRYRERVAA